MGISAYAKSQVYGNLCWKLGFKRLPETKWRHGKACWNLPKEMKSK